MHLHQANSHQCYDSLPVYTNLSQIYADIEGELCSKQSTLFNRLKNAFGSLYSGLLPSHYVIINHVLSLSDFAYSNTLTGKDIKMATQNGVILLLKQTYQGQKIFINGLAEQELIFQSTGSLSADQASSSSNQNSSIIIEDIQKIIQLATEELSLNKLYGATILVHSSIGETTKHYKEKLLLGIYLATLIINQQLDEISLEQIYHKLHQSHLFSSDFLDTQFMPFNKGELTVIQKPQNEEHSDNGIHLESFRIPNKEKFLFFDMNFTSQQLQNIKSHHSEIEDLLTKTQMSQIQQLRNKTSNQIHELQNGTITLSQFINSLQKQIQANPKLHALFSPLQKQIQTEIDEVTTLLGKDSNDCILNGNHLIFCMKSHEVHEKIRILRKFINNQLAQNPQIVTSRYNKSKGVYKIIFSGSPSLAVAILNPEHQMWFK